MNEKWFEDWFDSPYYHRLYHNRDEKDADYFINNLISHLCPDQDSKMLDVACGKGRHSRLLSEMGFDVTGIDISENSIQQALQYESESLHFYRHDMRFPFWVNYFDYAFNFFTSFGYFKTERENRNAIHTISSSLKAGGLCMIDYLNANKAVENLKEKETIERDDTLFHISRWHDEKWIYKKIEVNDIKENFQYSFLESVRKFSLDDFIELLQPNGLLVKSVIGEYDLSAFDPKYSNRLIIIAEKQQFS